MYIHRNHQRHVHCMKNVSIRNYFVSVFSRILTEYSPNAGKCGPDNFEYGHFSCSERGSGGYVECTFTFRLFKD